MRTMWPLRMNFGFTRGNARPLVEATPRLDVARVMRALRSVDVGVRVLDATGVPFGAVQRSESTARVVVVSDAPTLVSCVSIAAPFGGRRWFAVCPGCSRRVLALYVVDGRVACRVCGGLAYASQRLDARWRAYYEWRAFEARLDGVPDHLSIDDVGLVSPAYKPKRMHWRTFGRLSARYARSASVHRPWFAEARWRTPRANQ